MRKLKKQTVSSLIKKLDKVFSLYIRKRDADRKGYVRCITCRKVMRWQDVDAGHYISRRHRATRFDEQNVHAQCKGCNGFQGGNLDEYALALQEKYGKDILSRLNRKKNQIKKFTVAELETLIKEYELKEEIETYNVNATSIR